MSSVRFPLPAVTQVFENLQPRLDRLTASQHPSPQDHDAFLLESQEESLKSLSQTSLGKGSGCPVKIMSGLGLIFRAIF